MLNLLQELSLHLILPSPKKSNFPFGDFSLSDLLFTSKVSFFEIKSTEADFTIFYHMSNRHY